MTFFYWRTKLKVRPTMVNIQGIFDSYGNRLLFTVISNNPAGSCVGKLILSRKFLKIFPINKTRIYYKRLNEFFEQTADDIIPNYLIQGQETFAINFNDNFIRKNGIYKLTFYTSDGRCANTYKHVLGKLFK